MSRFVYIVDDEEAVRASLRALLATQPNLIVQPFSGGEQFLAEIDEREAGVVLLDIHMPGMSGMAVMRELQPLAGRFPTIIITGQGDVQLAVQAMKLGAIDFLEKPYGHQALFAALELGFSGLERARDEGDRKNGALSRINLLSSRERQVFGLLIDGNSNKAIAEQLTLSVRTVEVHRANLMGKLAVGSLPEAIRLAFTAGIVPSANGHSVNT